ncbi:MAG: ATP-binding protein [Deltaproteobacteria bacterium]|nr:ATP-binding protein [Deltaproteobacteria bacterium]
MFSSIKSKLAIWFFFIFSLLFTTFGYFLYESLESILMGSVDSHLHSEVQLIAGLLTLEKEESGRELSEAAIGEYARPLSGHYYQLNRPDGEIITRSPSLSIVDTALPIREGSQAALYLTSTGPDRGPIRILVQSFPTPSGDIIIQAGESLEETWFLLERFRTIIFIFFPAFFLLSLTGIIIITMLSLKKIDKFSEKVETITEKSLNERLHEEAVESELKPLASSFNTMLERIEESFEKQRRFLADASHDLRTPASVIKSHCDVTLGRERTVGEYIETLQTIEQTSEKMGKLIAKILEVARLDNKAYTLDMADVNLMELTNTVVRSLKPKSEEKSLVINLSGKEVTLKGDKLKLSELMSNIIENAINYNKKGGTIDIVISSQGDEIIIKVTDTGIGISKEEREKIFDRFYRIDKSRGLVEGSGLGLPIVKAIVEAHAGHVDVESEEEKGTTFTVRLPLLQVD